MNALSKSKLQAGALYLGDNGRCFCAAHAGATAHATGRDLSDSASTRSARPIKRTRANISGAR